MSRYVVTWKYATHDRHALVHHQTVTASDEDTAARVVRDENLARVTILSVRAVA